MTLATTPENYYRVYSFGYKFRFNKYVKYEIENYDINFYLDADDPDKYLRFVIQRMVVQPQCYSRICEAKSPGMSKVVGSIHAPLVINLCENDGHYYSNTGPSCGPDDTRGWFGMSRKFTTLAKGIGLMLLIAVPILFMLT
ncbi:hypothetical protein RF11_03602 [Thelohanellus kitauei]|uniref:Uncharacterized protein n=1 Tax=Thelohanellus kitauei TaxID=669202 RepID=A0A0C2NGL4_THEKT|nr:hypothetical protein RF11_03602 [Thelohanellus kitauei]